MPGRLPLEKILRIVKIRVETGMGYHRIAKLVGVHWRTVRKYVKLYEEA